MADLMGLPKVRTALQGHLMNPQDRQRMNSYARFCLKFQSKDLTKEVWYVGTGAGAVVHFATKHDKN